jgi:hypothetical protein
MSNPVNRKFGLRAIVVSVGALLLLTSAWAAQQSGILFPDWSKPTKGTYQEPAETIGKKTKQPWSVTTITSSIDSKPVKGKQVSVVGEIVDLSCYLQVGKHGDKHRECGQKCVRNGQPVGLLCEDGTVYLLIDEEHDPRRDGLTAFRQKAIDAMAYIVTINGTQTEVGGQKAIFVQGFVTKAGGPVKVDK